MSDRPGTTVGAALTDGRRRLVAAGVEGAALDAAVLLAHLLGWERSRLLAYPETDLSQATGAAYLALLERRIAGEPVAYLVGQREFMGLTFTVDRRVLVPRPETERLVELAIAALRSRPGSAWLGVDVGTGSGAIAISLTQTLPSLRMVASDSDADALAVAAVNRERHGGGDRLWLVCGSLLDWLGQPVDLITANLPYLRPDQAHAGISHEPAGALYSGADGFDHYRRLLAQAPAHLRPGGCLLAEIDPAQARLALLTAASVAPSWPASIQRDDAGHERILSLERPLP